MSTLTALSQTLAPLLSQLPTSPSALLLWLPALAIGAALGFFGGLFGIGGGIIAIPLLVLGFHMPQVLAQGTALVMMAPNLLVGWWRYSRRHPVPLRQALPLGGIAAATTAGVAQVATGLPTPTLRTLFAVFLALLALYLLRRQRAFDAPPLESTASRWRHPRHIPWVGLLGGSCMGLLGIGGGLVATPVFTQYFRQRQAIAQSLSLALVAPSSLIALLTYASAGQVDWQLGLPLALSGLFTVSAGVALAHRLPERSLRRFFSWMLLVTAVWLLLGLRWM
jgi:uncharacterized membrane protein YfcA